MALDNVNKPRLKGSLTDNPRDARMFVLLRDKKLSEHFGGESSLRMFLEDFFANGLDDSLYKMYNRFDRASYSVERLFETGSSELFGFKDYRFNDIDFLYKCMLRDCGYLEDFSFDVPQVIRYKSKDYVLPGLNQFTIDSVDTVNGTPVFFGVHYEDPFNVGYGRCFSPNGDILCEFGHFERPFVANVHGYEFLINRRDSSYEEYYTEPFDFINENGEKFLTNVRRYVFPADHSEPNKGMSIFYRARNVYLNGRQLKNISEKTMFINDWGIVQKVHQPLVKPKCWQYFDKILSAYGEALPTDEVIGEDYRTGEEKWSRALDFEVAGMPQFKGIRYINFASIKYPTNIYVLFKDGEPKSFFDLSMEEMEKVMKGLERKLETSGKKVAPKGKKL